MRIEAKAVPRVRKAGTEQIVKMIDQQRGYPRKVRKGER